MMNSCMKLAARLLQLDAKLKACAGEAALAASVRAAEIAREGAPVDSGELRGSISAEKTAGAGAVVRAGAPHAAMVEYGTRCMASRPFMLPAARAVEQEFARLAREAASAAVKEI